MLETHLTARQHKSKRQARGKSNKEGRKGKAVPEKVKPRRIRGVKKPRVAKRKRIVEEKEEEEEAEGEEEAEEKVEYLKSEEADDAVVWDAAVRAYDPEDGNGLEEEKRKWTVGAGVWVWDSAPVDEDADEGDAMWDVLKAKIVKVDLGRDGGDEYELHAVSAGGTNTIACMSQKRLPLQHWTQTLRMQLWLNN
jgi:hypothetical protein